jgi:hypothetical protein
MDRGTEYEEKYHGVLTFQCRNEESRELPGVAGLGLEGEKGQFAEMR